MDLKKVTWITSTRVHGTYDNKSTLCGHIFTGDNKTVRGELHKKKKHHCTTCFVLKQDFKSSWLEACCG